VMNALVVVVLGPRHSLVLQFVLMINPRKDPASMLLPVSVHENMVTLPSALCLSHLYYWGALKLMYADTGQRKSVN